MCGGLLVRTGRRGATLGLMGLISYHRAGVTKRQARAAIRASRRLSGAFRDVEAQNEQLMAMVDQQNAMIERLERELDDCAAGWRVDERAGPGGCIRWMPTATVCTGLTCGGVFRGD